MMDLPITIRRATRADRESLCDIQASSIRGLGRSHYSEEELDAWSGGLSPERYERPITEQHVIVAEHESEAVAFGILDFRAEEVVAVYVRPEYARQGVGSRILVELLSEARRRGLRRIHCESSLNAAKFYQSAGFSTGEMCKHKFPDGTELACVPMTMSLD